MKWIWILKMAAQSERWNIKKMELLSGVVLFLNAKEKKNSSSLVLFTVGCF